VESRPVRAIDGYRKPTASRNRRARAQLAFLSLALALLSAGCSLTMNIPGFGGDEEETTAGIAPAHVSVFAIPLDEEDWRRANAALSLAVDPQGAGLPVNWDNPASNRHGRFEPLGGLAVVGNTVCRPFRALVVQKQHEKTALREVAHEGQACRTGPGEWAMRDVKPLGQVAGVKEADFLLPKASPAMFQANPVAAPRAAPRRD
jgi:surface antigen